MLNNNSLIHARINNGRFKKYRHKIPFLRENKLEKIMFNTFENKMYFIIKFFFKFYKLDFFILCML